MNVKFISDKGRRIWGIYSPTPANHWLINGLGESLWTVVISQFLQSALNASGHQRKPSDEDVWLEETWAGTNSICNREYIGINGQCDLWLTLNESFNTSYYSESDYLSSNPFSKTLNLGLSTYNKRNDENCSYSIRKVENSVSQWVMAYNLYYVTLNIRAL